jgi:hypothetical protein
LLDGAFASNIEICFEIAEAGGGWILIVECFGEESVCSELHVVAVGEEVTLTVVLKQALL